jgi:hypothetical protein
MASGDTKYDPKSQSLLSLRIAVKSTAYILIEELLPII